MKLLFVTQIVDSDDMVLGAYHGWITEFAQRFKSVDVICLKEGKHALPANVRVYSLGKEHGRPALGIITYAIRFLKIVWRFRRDYDVVLVHMNQEYIFVGGWLWKLLRKRIYLWRNHYAGSYLTDIAAAFCTKIFCTSKHSYTARYAKTAIMPVGVAIEKFSASNAIARKPHSILFLARIAPSKQSETLIDALSILAKDRIDFTASFYGSPLPKDEKYYRALKEHVRQIGLAEKVSFYPGVPNTETPGLFHAHDIFANTSPSGMLDKTIFEAGASGCYVVAASADIKETAGSSFSYNDGNAADLAQCLKKALALSAEGRSILIREFEKKVLIRHTLSVLGENLAREMSL